VGGDESLQLRTPLASEQTKKFTDYKNSRILVAQPPRSHAPCVYKTAGFPYEFNLPNGKAAQYSHPGFHADMIVEGPRPPNSKTEAAKYRQLLSPLFARPPPAAPSNHAANVFPPCPPRARQHSRPSNGNFPASTNSILSVVPLPTGKSIAFLSAKGQASTKLYTRFPQMCVEATPVSTGGWPAFFYGKGPSWSPKISKEASLFGK